MMGADSFDSEDQRNRAGLNIAMGIGKNCDIKNAIIDLMKEVKKNKWKVKLAPETMGKVNVFGSIDEIARLVEDTGCSFCIDFAHILAREKDVDYEKVKRLFGKHDKWHCHFSGIEYGEKGERKHLKTPIASWKELIKNLPKDKEKESRTRQWR